jgi:hypothetical protein
MPEQTKQIKQLEKHIAFLEEYRKTLIIGEDFHVEYLSDLNNIGWVRKVDDSFHSKWQYRIVRTPKVKEVMEKITFVEYMDLRNMLERCLLLMGE